MHEAAPIGEANSEETFMSQLTSSADRTLSAFFDSSSEAQRAFDRLLALGIAESDVRLVPGKQSEGASEVRSEEHRGFFEALADFFMPDEDRYTYAEGLSRGGFLVVVSNLSVSQYDQAVDILDDEGSINLEEREESWRSEGWSGYSAETSSTYTAGSLSDRSRTASDDLDDEVIPVVDERLVVGKRDVNLGRVRVRSYVREEPVSANVNLHNETVTIERRAVDRPLGDADVVFQDRTIEAEEHAEEAVVAKEARVTEEIALRKESSDRTETITDTVRKTEVEIDDERESGVLRQNDR